MQGPDLCFGKTHLAAEERDWGQARRWCPTVQLKKDGENLKAAAEKQGEKETQKLRFPGRTSRKALPSGSREGLELSGAGPVASSLRGTC